MGWNNRKETFKFQKEIKEKTQFYRDNGMTESMIEECVAEEKEEFLRRRNMAEKGFVIVPLVIEDSNGYEHEYDPIAMSYTETYFDDPFEFGFDDPRLNEIYNRTDKVGKAIMRLIAEGLNQTQIAEELHLSKMAISKRIANFRK